MAGGIRGTMVHADSGYPELHKILVKNTSGTAITIGKIVTVVGASGHLGRLEVQLANGSQASSSNAREARGLLLVALTAIPAGGEGIAALYAPVSGDTTGLSVGDPVFLANGATGDFSAIGGSTSARLVGHVLAAGLVLLAPALMSRA